MSARDEAAWIAAKPNEYTPPELTPEQKAAGAATIEAAMRAREGGVPSLLDPPDDEDGPSAPVERARARVEVGGERMAMAPTQPTRSALGTSRSADAVTGKGARSFGNPRPHAEQQAAISAPTANGESLVKPPKGADSTLADSLAPQLGLGFEVDVVQITPPGLADKFVVPPFSVLDTRAGYWQDRRRAWMSLGVRGETSATHNYVPDSQGNSKRAPSGVYGGAGGAPAPLKADDHGGRKQGLIYGHGAPASDPGFYTKKTAVEKRLGREISIEEFRRDHYDRDESLGGQSESVKTGTSVFDPVLCEVAYRWFSGPGHVVLDPFAGGAVRGVLAGVLGRRYVGNELRPEQIADNRLQADALFAPDSGFDFGREVVKPEWLEGDATALGPEVGEALGGKADLVFTCPPYADLEVYSDNPRDLSTMPYPKFREFYAQAMAQAEALLKPNRFMVWVIGEARGKDGRCYGLVADTVQAAQACGLALYNEAILLNSVGSAALRAQLIVRTRKLTRVHQHVFVFVKGDPKKAALACGSAEVEA